MPDRALAHQINLAVPLAITRADRTQHIKSARAREGGKALKRVGIVRAGTQDKALGVGHRAGLGRAARLGKRVAECPCEPARVIHRNTPKGPVPTSMPERQDIRTGPLF